MTKFLKQNIFIFVIFIIITFVAYGNILTNKLFYDDEELIYQNAYVKDLRNFPKFFTENMVAGAGKTSNMYRPILLTSFALDYAVWKNNPIGYHLTSIFLHAANSILIFIFVYWLFKNKILALITSLLFIIHPVQTETIAYASGRTDALYCFFGLISLLAFVSSMESKKYFLIRYIISIIFFVLAILSKETAIVFPFLFILASLIKSRTTIRRLTVMIIPFFLIVTSYIILRLTIFNFVNTLNFYQEKNIYSENLLVRLLTFSGVFFQYLSVIFFPYELIFARNVPIIISPLNFWVIAFMFVFFTLLIFSLVLRKKNAVFFFSFLWFFICIFPVSGVIPINSIIAEHYLYLPSLSFFLIIAYFFCFLYKKYPQTNRRILLIFTGTTICLLLILRTITRNSQWRDPITFYTKSLMQSPWHIPMRHNLAMAYAENGKLDEAIIQYQQIIADQDIYPNPHHNLANIYKELGRYQEAEEEYLKALKIDPNFHFSYMGLLDLYQKTGEKDKLNALREKL